MPVMAFLTYYSLLRPLSEVQIAALFARLEPYLPVFTSCNAAFRIEEGRRVERWCGHCPKCRFVALALAPFLPPERLSEFMGANPLSDERQLAGYRELLGLRYRRGDEPPAAGEPDDADWLVLVDADDTRKLAFQKVDRLERTTWPRPDVPMQLHLEMRSLTSTFTAYLLRQDLPRL